MSEIQKRRDDVEPVAPAEWHGDRRQPWDRFDDEPIEDYALFEAYRSMGPGRSQRKLSEKVNTGVGILARVAARNSWLARAEAFDAETQRLALVGLESTQVEMRERHAAMAAKLIDKAEKAIEHADPRFIHPRDIPVWIDVAAKLERLSRGVQDTKRVEITGKDGGPIEMAQNLTAQQRRELLDAAGAELAKRVQRAAIEDIIEGEIVSEEDDEDG